MYDAIIIGGGASGLMAAVTLKSRLNSASVAVIERLDRVGKKLSLTGNGRCNISNLYIGTDNYYGQNPDFCVSALSKFGVEDTSRFFEEIGVVFKAEGKKLFPRSLQASSVVDALRFKAENLGVTIITGEQIDSIKQKNGIFRLTGNSEYTALSVIVACGGMAGGKIANDSGYRLLKALGHKCTDLSPAIVQVKTDTSLVRQLKGIKVDARISVLHNNKITKSDFGELLFCDYGISGPPVLQLSRHMKKGDGIVIDLMPDYGEDELVSLLESRAKLLEHLTLAEFFCGLLQKRLGQVLIKYCGYNINESVSVLDRNAVLKLCDAIKHFRLSFEGTNGFANAQVTHGGISTAEFMPDTLMSKLCRGLFASGELLDIDGDCGGYNLQWAWSSGYCAALGCAKFLEERK